MIPYVCNTNDTQPKYLINTYNGETVARVTLGGFNPNGGSSVDSFGMPLPNPSCLMIYGDVSKISVHPILKLVSHEGEFLFYVDVFLYNVGPQVSQGHLNVLDNFEVVSRLKAFSPENQKVKFK